MKITSFTVRPKLPPALKALEEIANNLWLSWNFDAVMLFIRLDYETWMHSQQNPARMLGVVKQDRLDRMAEDDSYLAALKEVYDRFCKYRQAKTWYKGDRGNAIAYFSMEYGLDVSLPIYSGGLGVLSGDHLKTASDLGLPLIGVGLLYRQGYFKQYLNADGFQQESYPENDWYNMPVQRLDDNNGKPIRIVVDMAGQAVTAQLWAVSVGRIKLILLDTNIDENSTPYRNISAALYDGDQETRIRQEMLLGIGGIRALEALGVKVAVAHMNEGHSAFLALERIRAIMVAQGFSFAEAREALWPTNIFTTHTPVPAGNERFPVLLIEKYFNSWARELGLEWRDFLALGRENPNDQHEDFCMTVLALRLSAYSNGVSKLHGEVSRKMWQGLWPQLPIDEIPIDAVTNGVHPRTWVFNNMVELLDRYFGPHFEEEPTDLSIWNRMDRISDEELWRTHERRRERMVAFARDRIRQQLKRYGATDSRIRQAEDALSPYALTLAFARRFATYKRATLLLRDPERLLKLLRDNDRPIQLIFAGKAHPHDLPGKELIKDLIHFAEHHDVTSKIVFLEDYDMTIARYLTSGSDLWLNTPRRPLEASGTSGMKAAMNGVLNCSVMDGWWDEAYHPELGWAIGRGEQYDDVELQDEVESKALYNLLEREIIPLFYQRGRDNLPREWIKRMKNCMKTIGQSMSSHRMLMDYSERCYLPALRHYRRQEKTGFLGAQELAAYFLRLEQLWSGVSVVKIESNVKPVMRRGETVTVRACIKLGGLKPDEVAVELYSGTVSSRGELEKASRLAMSSVTNEGDCWRYELKLRCEDTGLQGYTVRVLPKHPALVHPYRPSFIKWA